MDGHHKNKKRSSQRANHDYSSDNYYSSVGDSTYTNDFANNPTPTRVQLAAYKTYAYDNPNYTESAINPTYDFNGGKMPFSHSSESYSVSDEQRDRDDKKRWSRKSAHKCKVIAAILVLAVIVVAGISLAIYFSAQAMSDNNRVQGSAVTTETPVPTQAPQAPAFVGEIRVTSEEFTPELANPDSPEFKNKKAEVEEELDKVFQNSPIGPAFNYTDVTGFGNGSLKVNFTIYLKEKKKVSAQNQQVIEDAEKDPTVVQTALLKGYEVMESKNETKLVVDKQSVAVSAAPTTTTSTTTTTTTAATTTQQTTTTSATTQQPTTTSATTQQPTTTTATTQQPTATSATTQQPTTTSATTQQPTTTTATTRQPTTTSATTQQPTTTSATTQQPTTTATTQQPTTTSATTQQPTTTPLTAKTTTKGATSPPTTEKATTPKLTEKTTSTSPTTTIIEKTTTTAPTETTTFPETTTEKTTIPTATEQTTTPSSAMQDTKCPGWSDVAEVMSSSCNNSLMAMMSTVTPEEACLHYSSTIKCGVFIMRTRNRTCDVKELLMMARNNTGFFAQQAAGIDVTSKCPDADSKFSVDLDKTPLCLVPDALTYIMHYVVNDVDDTHRNLLPFRPNPCSLAIQKAASVNNVMESLGQRCNITQLSTALLEQDYSAMPEIQRAADSCSAYSRKSKTDRCFNISNSSLQRACGMYLYWLYDSAYMPQDQSCSMAHGLLLCMSKETGCSLEETQESAMNFWSVVLTYYQLYNVSIAGNANYHNVFNFLACDHDTKCPDWSDVSGVMSSSCNYSMVPLMAATTPDEACLHYSSTIKCGVFILRTKYRKCDVMDLLEMARNNTGFFSKQTAGIDVTSKCSDTDSKFSVDLDKTPLCLVPDALTYIMHYVVNDVDDTHSNLHFRPNPCTLALQKTASVNNVMESLGQRCNITQLSTALLEQDYSAMPEFQRAADSCNAYSRKQKTDRCFNISDSLLQSACGKYLFRLYDSAYIPVDQVCSTAQELLTCASKVTGCSLEETQQSAMDLWSVVLTFQGLFNVSIAGNANYYNVFNFLACDNGTYPLSSCPDWNTLWKMVEDSCMPSIQLTKATPSLESACYHYASSLKCASFISRLSFFDCGVKKLAEMAVNDTRVFTKQVMGYNVSELCVGTNMSWISKPDKTFPCESPDALLYIAEYICQDGHYDDTPTHLPYTDKTRQYDTTTPTGFQRFTNYNYPGKSSGTGPPSKPTYPGMSTTTTPPWRYSTQGYDKTTQLPYHYTTESTAWPDRRTSTTDMPYDKNTPCSAFIRRSQCIHQNLNDLRLFCPKVRVIDVLKKYNKSILTKEVKQCEDYHTSAVSEKCFSKKANQTCMPDLSPVFVKTYVSDACRWWYKGPLQCLQRNTGNNCSISAVDKAWRGYLKMLVTVNDLSKSFSMLNVPVIKKILMCPAEPEKRGCPSYDMLSKLATEKCNHIFSASTTSSPSTSHTSFSYETTTMPSTLQQQCRQYREVLHCVAESVKEQHECDAKDLHELAQSNGYMFFQQFGFYPSDCDEPEKRGCPSYDMLSKLIMERCNHILSASATSHTSFSYETTTMPSTLQPPCRQYREVLHCLAQSLKEQHKCDAKDIHELAHSNRYQFYQQLGYYPSDCEEFSFDMNITIDADFRQSDYDLESLRIQQIKRELNRTLQGIPDFIQVHIVYAMPGSMILHLKVEVMRNISFSNLKRMATALNHASIYFDGQRHSIRKVEVEENGLCGSKNCHNNGLCIGNRGISMCVCPQGNSGKYCETDTKCPDWSDVAEVMSSSCNYSIMAMMSAATPDEACLHYSSTIKCGVFIMRTKHRKCDVMDLLEMARNNTGYFPKQAAGIDVTSKCSDADSKFSVDLDKTPLCLVPDALMYIMHYVVNDVDDTHHSLLPFRPNPCTPVLEKVASVNKVMESLGQRCNITQLSAALFEQDYSTMSEIQQAVDSCIAYSVKSRTDRCFNISDSSLQATCGMYLYWLYDSAYMPQDQSCSMAHGLLMCMSKETGCSLEETQESAMNFWSVVLTYHQLYNVSIAGNANYRSVFNFLACDYDTKCPDWSDVSEVMSSSCNYSMMPLMAATTPDEACLHFSSTIKCGVFILRTKYRKCNVMDLLEMARNNTGFFSKQAAGIDVTSKCSDTDSKFSVDLDKTPLCLVPDALTYIMHYVVNDVDDTHSNLLHFRPNPCTLALQKTASVNNVMESLGQRCNITQLSTALLEQDYSAMPEFQRAADSCNAYSRKQKTDRCFNISDGLLQSACGKYLFRLYDSAYIPVDQVCSTAQELLTCASKVTGCSLEETQQSAMDLWSVVLTFQGLFNMSIAGNANYYNVFNFLACDNGTYPLSSCPDWDTLWKMVEDSCMPSIQLTKATPSLESACYHYASSLKCASFISRLSFFDCGVKKLAEMAVNDTWVFTNQVMGYNVSEHCVGTNMSWISKPDKTFPCESPDALLYIAEYICHDGHYDDTPTHLPYTDKARQYDTTTPTGFQRFTNYNYPGKSSGTGPPSKPTYPGMSTTTTPPWRYSTQGYDKTTQLPYHYTTESTAWPDRRTSTTDMPYDKNTPCSAFIRRSQCIHQNLNDLRLFCPKVRVIDVLKKYNKSILTKEVKQCEDYHTSAVSKKCFSIKANQTCMPDLSPVFVKTYVSDACRWWYKGPLQCLHRNTGNNCSISAVDKAWRGYLKMLVTVDDLSKSFSMLNVPVIKKILMCPAEPEKRGCPSYDILSKLTTEKCNHIFSASTTSSPSTSHTSFSYETTTMPTTLQQQCRQYREVLHCVAESVKEQHECDAKDLHELAQSNGYMFYQQFGFYPSDCDDFSFDMNITIDADFRESDYSLDSPRMQQIKKELNRILQGIPGFIQMHILNAMPGSIILHLKMEVMRNISLSNLKRIMTAVNHASVYFDGQRHTIKTVEVEENGLCARKNCHNNGLCISNRTVSVCVCPQGYSGKYCETGNMSSCPDWNSLWKMVEDSCMPSIILTKTSPDLESACYHYVSSLKCASFISRTMLYNCSVSLLAKMASNDTWVFMDQEKKYNVSEKCADTKMDWISKPQDTPPCESPDAYRYIVKYICSDGRVEYRFTHSPFPDKTTRSWRYDTTTPAGPFYQRSSSQKYPGKPATTEVPSKGTYTGMSTTTRPPSYSTWGYDKTTRWPVQDSHYSSQSRTETTAWPYWRTTTTTDMPHYTNTPCSEYIQWGQCIHQTMNDLQLFCPRDRVFKVLGKYNQSILPEPANQCQEPEKRGCPSYDMLSKLTMERCNHILSASATSHTSFSYETTTMPSTLQPPCRQYREVLHCLAQSLKEQHKCDAKDIHELAHSNRYQFYQQLGYYPSDCEEFSFDMNITIDADFRQSDYDLESLRIQQIKRELNRTLQGIPGFIQVHIVYTMPGSMILHLKVEVMRNISFSNLKRMATALNHASIYLDGQRHSIRKVEVEENGLCGSKNCRNNGLCIGNRGISMCVCPQGNSGKYCETDTKCPDWSDVAEVMSSSCNYSIMAMMSAATPDEACLHYSSTIKCGVFIMRTKHRKCDVMDLLEMARNNTGYFPKQAAGIDVTSKCSDTDSKFSVDLDKTPLCLVPDALTYIMHYVVNDVDDTHSNLHFRPNPCTLALQKTASVNNVMESLGQRCNITQLSTALLEQDYSAMPEFQRAADSCNAYSRKQKTDRCFNISDSLLQSACGKYLFRLYDSAYIPVDQVCSTAQELLTCASKVTGCSLEETQQSAMDLWSVVLTFQGLFNVSIAGNANYYNVFNFLACDNGTYPLSSCPDWNTLWKMVEDSCMPSIQLTKATPSLESACYHYASSLKCASFISRLSFFDCGVKKLAEMAVNDTRVFTKQVMGYNVSEQCVGTNMSWISKPDKTFPCESPDALLYIAEYICHDGHYDDTPTHLPYTDKARQYDTTTPTGFQRFTNYNYPGKSSGTGPPSKPTYPGMSTTTTPPWRYSTQGYDKTTQLPYHYTTESTAWPDRRTSTTDMPYDKNTPCSAFIRRSQCIHQNLNDLQLFCPKVRVIDVLKKYNKSILTKEVKQCEDYHTSAVSEKCFSIKANQTCMPDLSPVFVKTYVSDACRWWYKGPLQCLHRNTGNNCSISAVDKAWRGYLKMLVTVDDLSKSFSMLNVPVIKKILMCPAEPEKRGCSSYDILSKLATEKCNHIFSASTTSSPSTSHTSFSYETTTMPTTLQQQCREYREVLHCVAESVKEQHECDAKDLHELAQSNGYMFYQQFGFYPSDCDDFSFDMNITIDADFRESDYILDSPRMQQIKKELNRILQGIPGFIQMHILNAMPGSIILHLKMEVMRNISLSNLKRIMTAVNHASVYFDGQRHTIKTVEVEENGLCARKNCHNNGLCISNRTVSVCVCPQGYSGKYCETGNMSSCPDWNSLWKMVKDSCMPSIILTKTSPDLESACYHYVSSLKCASFISRTMLYNCSVSQLAKMASNDTWVFMDQEKKYNVSEKCADTKMDWISKPQDTPPCESPDAYRYIVKYICSDGRVEYRFTHSPFPDKTTRSWRYDTTTPAGPFYQRSSSQKYPGKPATTEVPSKGTYTGMSTTTRPPSYSTWGYDKTTRWPVQDSHYSSQSRTETTAWPYWRTTTTTDMPHYTNTPCSEYIQWGQCIHQTMNDLQLFCPRDRVFKVLGKYNQSILPEPANQCQEPEKRGCPSYDMLSKLTMERCNHILSASATSHTSFSYETTTMPSTLQPPCRQYREVLHCLAQSLKEQHKCDAKDIHELAHSNRYQFYQQLGYYPSDCEEFSFDMNITIDADFRQSDYDLESLRIQQIKRELNRTLQGIPGFIQVHIVYTMPGSMILHLKVEVMRNISFSNLKRMATALNHASIYLDGQRHSIRKVEVEENGLCGSKNCRNNGLCIGNREISMCVCPQGNSGKYCETDTKCPDWSDVAEVMSSSCNYSIMAMMSAATPDEACLHYSSTIKCGVFIMRTKHRKCDVMDLLEMARNNTGYFPKQAAGIDVTSKCSDADSKFSVDLDKTPLCLVPDALTYIMHYVVNDVDDTHSNLLHFRPNPCTLALRKTASVNNVMESLGQRCNITQLSTALLEQDYSAMPEFQRAADSCNAYSRKQKMDRCFNITDSFLQYACGKYLFRLYDSAYIPVDQVCSTAQELLTCASKVTGCSLEETQQSAMDLWSVVLTFQGLFNVSIAGNANYYNVFNFLACDNGTYPLSSCPDWDTLWKMVEDSCMPSIQLTKATPSLESACYHYASSLKCASFISRLSFFDCGVKKLAEMAVNDTRVFTNQVMGYNVSEQCVGTNMSWISKPDKTFPCESPDALLYIAEYICQDGHYDDTSTHLPYTDKTRQYDTTTPTGFQKFTNYNYPGKSASTRPPSEPTYPGMSTTTTPPRRYSTQGYNKTTQLPYHYTTESTAWPDRRTSTTDMPYDKNTPCSAFIRRSQCIHQNLNDLQLFCPKVRVIDALKKYNKTILTKEVKQCEEYHTSAVSGKCFSKKANQTCMPELSAVFVQNDISDACRWWYNGPLQCLQRNTGNNCSISAVDKAWRGYLKMLVTVKDLSKSLSTLNVPVIKKILMCPAGRPGECRPSNTVGITLHECNNDFDCGHPKKCCEVGHGAGQVCQDPVYPIHFSANVLIDAQFRDTDYNLQSQRMIQLKEELWKLLESFPDFLGLEIKSSRPGSILVQVRVTMAGKTTVDEVQNILNKIQRASITLDGRSYSIIKAYYDEDTGMCKQIHCANGLCMMNTTKATCACYKGYRGEHCEYGDSDHKVRDCWDWQTVWSHVSGPCLRSIMSARHSYFDQCSHYAAFVRCAAFVMRSQHYNCSEDIIRRMALANFRDFRTESSSSDWSGHQTTNDYSSSEWNKNGATRDPYSSSMEHHRSSSAHYGSSSSIYSSSDSMTNDHSDSDQHREASDTLYPSYTAEFSGHYESSTNYQPGSSSYPHNSWDGNMGSSYESSLPFKCRNHRLPPPKVDMVKTEPCLNPDAYEYILKYHCGDDMNHRPSTPNYDQSSSNYYDTWHPSRSDTWRPTPSYTQHQSPSDTWRPTPSYTQRPSPSDTWRPTPSNTQHPSPSDTWRPTPSNTQHPSLSDTWRPTPSIIQHPSPSDTWRPTPSSTWHPPPSDTWRPATTRSPPDEGYPNVPSWSPCSQLVHRYQCIQKNLQDIGLMCPVNTIIRTSQYYAVSLPAAEVRSCTGYGHKVMTNRCINLTSTEHCAQDFSFLSNKYWTDGACGSFQRGMQCISKVQEGCSFEQVKSAWHEYLRYILTMRVSSPFIAFNYAAIERVLACSDFSFDMKITVDVNFRQSDYDLESPRQQQIKSELNRILHGIPGFIQVHILNALPGSMILHLKVDVMRNTSLSNLKRMMTALNRASMYFDNQQLSIINVDVDEKGLCARKNCRNNGMCVSNGTVSMCVCPQGYNGKYCETGNMSSCSDWNSLWKMVKDSCMPSIVSTKTAPDLESACYHYVSSLKCASLISRTMFYNCSVSQLAKMASNDTWVFMDQEKKYNVSEKCAGTEMDWISKPQDTPLCESPDAYQYIVKYICSDGRVEDKFAHSPFPNKTTRSWQYDTTTPTGPFYQRSSSQKYPGKPTTTEVPSKGTYTGMSTTTRPPSYSTWGYDKTTWWPVQDSHYSSQSRTETTAWPYWRTTTTTDMPHYTNTPCSEYIEWGQCIHRTMNDLQLFCPRDRVFEVLGKYNQSILPEPANQCQEPEKKGCPSYDMLSKLATERCNHIFSASTTSSPSTSHTSLSYDTTTMPSTPQQPCRQYREVLHCVAQSVKEQHKCDAKDIHELVQKNRYIFYQQFGFYPSDCNGKVCPTFQELLNKTSRGFDNVTKPANMTGEKSCRLFEDFRAIWRHYPQCSEWDLQTLVSNNQDAIRNLTGENLMNMRECAVPKPFFVDYDALDAINSQGNVTRGRVAVKYRGIEGYYCSNGTAHTEQSASVMCRAMGFSRGGEVLQAKLPFPQKYSVGWTMPTTCHEKDSSGLAQSCVAQRQLENIHYMSRNHSNGTGSSNLTSCGKSVAVISCFEDNYRLALTINSSSKGLLLVWNQKQEQWDPVCRDNFGALEANITCLQLGLPRNGHVTSPGKLPVHSYDYVLGSIIFTCNSSNGKQLDNCTAIPRQQCKEHNPVWLACDNDVD